MQISINLKWGYLMSNAAEHRAIALKWLRSTEAMQELFRLETEIVTMMARYNLAKSSLTDDIGEIVISLHDLLDRFESLLNSVKNRNTESKQSIPSNGYCQKQVKSVDVNMSCVVNSSKEVDSIAKPEDWDSLTIPERIAFRKANAVTERKGGSVDGNLSSIRKGTELMRNQISNPSSVFDNKFDLSDRDFNEDF